MSLGLQVIAAAANHRPIDIKKLVEAALFDRASAVLTEGYRIVAAEQYGGLDESRYRGETHKGYSANRKARRAQKTDNSPNADKLFYYNKKSSERFGKHLDKSNGEKEAAARTKNLVKMSRPKKD